MNTRKTEELFAIFLTNPVRYVSGWKLSTMWPPLTFSTWPHVGEKRMYLWPLKNLISCGIGTSYVSTFSQFIPSAPHIDRGNKGT